MNTGIKLALSGCINSYKSRRKNAEDTAALIAWFESVESFIECQWFWRSWVEQEFFVAPRPAFISNDVEVHFNYLFQILEIVRSISLDGLFNSTPPDANSISHGLNAMRELGDGIYNLNPQIDIRNFNSQPEDKPRRQLFDITKAFHSLTSINLHPELSAHISGSGGAFNFSGGYYILWEHIQAKLYHLEEWHGRAREGEASTALSLRIPKLSFEKLDFAAVSSVMDHKQSM
jgi:hypothetical protein